MGRPKGKLKVKDGREAVHSCFPAAVTLPQLLPHLAAALPLLSEMLAADRQPCSSSEVQALGVWKKLPPQSSEYHQKGPFSELLVSGDYRTSSCLFSQNLGCSGISS